MTHVWARAGRRESKRTCDAARECRRPKRIRYATCAPYALRRPQARFGEIVFRKLGTQARPQSVYDVVTRRETRVFHIFISVRTSRRTPTGVTSCGQHRRTRVLRVRARRWPSSAGGRLLHNV